MSLASKVRDDLETLKEEGRILGATADKLDGRWRFAIALGGHDRLLWFSTSEAEAFVLGATATEGETE